MMGRESSVQPVFGGEFGFIFQSNEVGSSVHLFCMG